MGSQTDWEREPFFLVTVQGVEIHVIIHPVCYSVWSN